MFYIEIVASLAISLFLWFLICQLPQNEFWGLVVR